MTHRISINVIGIDKKNAFDLVEETLKEIKKGICDCSEHTRDENGEDIAPYRFWTSYNIEKEELKNSTFFEEINGEEIIEVNTENNLSDKYYEQPRTYSSYNRYSGNRYGGSRFSSGRRKYNNNRRSSYRKWNY